MNESRKTIVLLVWLLAGCGATPTATEPLATQVASSGRTAPTSSVTPPPTASPTASPTATATDRPTHSLPATPSPNPGKTPDQFAPGPPATRTIEVEAHQIEGPLDGTVRPSGVWTGSEAIFWGGWTQDDGELGISGMSDKGAAYNPRVDRWRRIADAPIAPRADHLATWTGEEMLIWGGYAEGDSADGAAYEPLSDSWRRLPPVPSGNGLNFERAIREELEFAHIWTGSEWVIAYKEGFDETREVLRAAGYDPVREAWRRLPDAKVSRTDVINFASTGELLLLAHFEGLLSLGPGASEWVAASQTPGELPIRAPMVWVDDRLIASLHRFGPGDVWAFLSAWDPATDEWEVLAQPPATIASAGLVSDGRHVIPIGSNLAYDTESREWWEVRMSVPERRTDYATVWTGRQMIVWGGWVCGTCPQDVFDRGLIFRPRW